MIIYFVRKIKYKNYSFINSYQMYIKNDIYILLK